MPSLDRHLTVPCPRPAGPPRLLFDERHLPDTLRVPHLRLTELHGDASERLPRPQDPATLVRGDNLEVVAWLLAHGWAGQARLVVIDPPFASGADYARKVRLRGAEGRELPLERVQYSDRWSGHTYLQFMFLRLLALRELLALDGSLVLHADKHRGHLLRALLDEVFGPERFVNEIVWHYPDNFQGNVRGFANNHDTLYWYSRSPRWVHHPVHEALDRPVKRDRRVWDPARRAIVAARDEHGRLLYDEHTHRKLDDVWRIGQSAVSKRRSAEHTGYPTQKPHELVRRLILAASNPGDLVVDAFVGSGTTAVAAQGLGRRWLGVDRNVHALRTTLGRLPQVAVRVADATDADGVVGSGPTHLTAVAHLERLGPGATVVLDGAASPLLPPAEDPRSLLARAELDPDHDGRVFRARVVDQPARSGCVAGRWTLAEAGAEVALRLCDVAGDELVLRLRTPGAGPSPGGA